MPTKTRAVMPVEQLNDMQRYLGEETYDDYKAGIFNRRRMLKRLILICGSSAGAAALLAACGDTATPAATAVATTTSVATTAVTTTTATTTNSATTTTSSAATTSAGATPSTAVKSPLSVAADDPAIEASDVTFQSDTQMFGYLVKPKASGTYPGVIVIHENRGLTDHIKDVARRVAKAGYIALAPDLASRAGGTAKVPTDQVTGYFGNAKPDDLTKDLNAGVDFLQKQTGVQAAKLGVVGFCFGGGYALKLTAVNPKIIAVVSYYGPVPQPASQMSATNAAILGQYGALDTRVDSMIPDMEKVLKDSGKTFVKNVYEGANHAFNNDTGASYNEAAALKAWSATLDWFNKYLKS
jgi:carboxymethylenebutenolidase